jgi:E3 ubiquitin-protein ligase HECTD1
MRLVDLLLVLLFEGRKALSRTGMGCVGAGQLIPRFRRMDSAGEKSHRQLIDCIRSKDTDALVEAIDTGGMPSITRRTFNKLCSFPFLLPHHYFP